MLDAVDSTNAESLRAPEPWRFVTAAAQIAGRGRRSRGWASPAGSSVSVSLTVPLAPQPADWGWLPLLTGVAMSEALADILPGDGGLPGDGQGTGRFALKWPNDVLAADPGVLGGWGKVCGILCETVLASASSRRSSGEDHSRGHLVVVGVGVNVTQDRANLPVDTATSLRLIGVDGISRESLLVAFSRRFLDRYDAWVAGGTAFDQARTAYLNRCRTIGSDVVVHLPTGDPAEGRAVGVAPGGGLLVSTGAGAPVEYAAGDVVHVRPGQAAATLG